MSYQDEPQAGGLIDIYWILDWIIMPLIFITFLIGISYLMGQYLSCPYMEDVSSCFPYNLPNYLKIALPLGLIISVVICWIVLSRINGEVGK